MNQQSLIIYIYSRLTRLPRLYKLLRILRLFKMMRLLKHNRNIKRLFDQMKAPAELWMLPDQHHNGSVTAGGRALVWQVDIHSFVCDWLRERFEGKPVKHPGKTLWLDPNSGGPSIKNPTFKRYWYE